MLNLILIFIAGSIAYTGLSVAPWFPARRDALERIHVLADLKPGQTFYELGCGDGRVCFYLAKKNSKAHIIGIEYNYYMYLISKIRNYFHGFDNVKIIFGNAYKQDLSKMDVIYVYGIKNTVNNKLKKKFEKELKPGGKIISYTFPINEWKGTSRLDHVIQKAPIYVYEK